LFRDSDSIELNSSGCCSWLVGAKLAVSVAALLPRGYVSQNVGDLVLFVGSVVFIWRGGGYAVIHVVGPPSAVYLR